MKIVLTAAADPEAWVEARIADLKRAVSNGVLEAAEGLQADLRAQVRAAGLGRGLANAIRVSDHPTAPRTSLDAAAVVYAQRGKRGRGGADDILDAFDKGALIRSSEGFFLAIPTPEVANMRVGRRQAKITPRGFEQATGLPLRFVFRRGKPGLLVVDSARLSKRRGQIKRKGGRRRRDGILTGEQSFVAFILIPQAKLPKKLDFSRDARKWGALAPQLVARELKKVANGA